jgi:hypothetical protein
LSAVDGSVAELRGGGQAVGEPREQRFYEPVTSKGQASRFSSSSGCRIRDAKPNPGPALLATDAARHEAPNRTPAAFGRSANMAIDGHIFWQPNCNG